MARSRSRSRRRDGNADETPEEEVEAVVVPDEEPASGPVPEEPVAAPHPTAQVIPIREARITIDRFVRGLGPLGEAFAHCEQIEHTKTRKLTKAEWQLTYEEWMKRPRG